MIKKQRKNPARSAIPGKIPVRRLSSVLGHRQAKLAYANQYKEEQIIK
jgi:hypothetical protein